MNPYHRLLGFPESVTAPDHYELLGVPRFTQDQNVIHQALVGRSTQLRQWQNSKWFLEAEQLHNEVIAAAEVLEDLVRKAEYDTSLGGQPDVVPPPEANPTRADPWATALSHLDTYQTTQKFQVLKRGEELAVVARGEPGRTEYQREALRRGIDRGYSLTLVENVEQTGNTVCPICWNEFPVRSISDVRVDREGNVESSFITIRRAQVHFVWDGVEVTNWDRETPGWVLSRAGMLAFIALVTLVPSLVLLLLGGGHTDMQFAGTTGIGICITASTIAFAKYYPKTVSPLSFAWATVVPDLVEEHLAEHSDFVAGLAVASIGKDGRNQREPLVRQALELIAPLVRQDEVPPEHLADLLRAYWGDALSENSSHGALVDIARECMRNTLYGNFPIATLDFASSDGSALENLKADDFVWLVWSLVERALSNQFTAADVQQLAQESSTVRIAFRLSRIPLETLPYLFAITSLEKSESVPRELATARQLLMAGKFKEFRDRPSLLGQTGKALGDPIHLTPYGIELRGKLFESPFEITITPHTTFVQTGWKHQRKDGEPDKRFADNEPTGYQKTYAWTFTCGDVNWRDSTDPSDLLERLATMVRFYFEVLQPTAKELGEQPISSRYLELVVDPSMPCPHCGEKLRPRAGQLAISYSDESA